MLCYVWDVLSVDDGADVAMVARMTLAYLSDS